MSKVKIKLNRKGVKELLNCKEIEEYCEQIANNIATRAGEGYAAGKPHHTGQRVAVNVYAKSREAKEDNLNNNTLQKAVRA